MADRAPSETETQKPVAVITGTSRGLGRALAEHFLARGHAVAGCSRGEGTIDHEAYHHTVVDIREETEVQAWARALRREFGGVDLLIGNAGLARSALYLAMTPGDVFDDFLRVNFAGVFFTLREFSKLMLRRPDARVITISSTMVPLHQEGTSCYAATKAAVEEMTKVLARELAPQGITCNVIAPAMMDTEASRELAKDGDWKERMLEKQTIPRVIGMDEICHVADFFVSPLAGAVTGQVVYVGLVD